MPRLAFAFDTLFLFAILPLLRSDDEDDLGAVFAFDGVAVADCCDLLFLGDKRREISLTENALT